MKGGRVASFGKVSVVVMAEAVVRKALCDEDKDGISVGIPERILSVGSL